MKLIITEKVNAAKRIASILSKGKAKAEKSGTMQVFSFSANGEDAVCFGLKGHVLKVEFPEEYSNWQKVEPEALISADIIKSPIYKNIVKLIETTAKKVDELVVATDFDREGELIGVDTVNIALKANPKLTVKRARYSALTEQEITHAFDNLDEVYYSLASAGEARQDIDLVWGATLTRFISLASTRLGKNFLSVGRVQSPTLCLIAKREQEREAFVPEKYWQLKAIADKDERKITFLHKNERFLDQAEAKAAFEKITDKAEVTEVKKTSRKIDPPAPFNTTGFLTAAASIGVTASRAMSIAESLYLDGYVSYPRVDNTVYPPSLDIRGILTTLSPHPALGGFAKELLQVKEYKPTRGKKEATDHPPIHPTGVVKEGEIDPTYYRIYELIVRRFYATIATSAQTEGVRVDISSGGEPLFARGTRVVSEGFTRYYPYGRKTDEELPEFKEAEVVNLIDKTFEDKETSPPPRYSQSQLIQTMEDLDLGTKSTRHSIIQNLIERGYVHGEPLTPTEMGLKVAGALIKYADRIASPEMTADLELQMTEIAEGRAERVNVVQNSRDLLQTVMVTLKENKEQLGTEIREGIRGDMTVGKCKTCGKDLVIRFTKKTPRKRFVGCSGWPDCNTVYSLPQFGSIIGTGESCELCGAPKIKVISKGKRPWETCINLDCESVKKKNTDGADGEGGEGGADAQKFPEKIGPCPKCSKDLKVMFSRRKNKHFIGCSGFPKCKNGFPLPPTGFEAPVRNCDVCNSPVVKYVNEAGETIESCIDPNCEKHIKT